MKYCIFCLIILYPVFASAQKLELINLDNVKNLPLGQGLQLGLRLKIDESNIDRRKYKVILEPKLESKFIVIPKDTGLHKIGPIISGKLISNSIVIHVVQATIDSAIVLTVPDSAFVGEEVKLTLTNLSKSDDYTIKDLKMKLTNEYDVVGQSFSMSGSTSGNGKIRKETLIILIKPVAAGEILIDENRFNAENMKNFSVKSKILKVFPSIK